MKRKWPLVTVGMAAALSVVGGGAYAMTADHHHAAPTASAVSGTKVSAANVSTFVANPSSASEASGVSTGTAAKRVSDLLKPGQLLRPGQYRRSSNGRYILTQQTDGNLVMYRGRTALWSSRTKGRGVFTAMQTDGNLVVYRGRTPLWSSVTGRNPGAVLAVQTDGNLVIYSKHGTPLWWRNISIGALNPGYALLPGQAVVSPSKQYFLLMQTDGNLVLYRGTLLNRAPKQALWSSRTKGSGLDAQMQFDGNFVVYRGRTPLWSSVTGRRPGAFLEMQDDGNVVVYKGRTPLWSTGT